MWIKLYKCPAFQIDPKAGPDYSTQLAEGLRAPLNHRALFEAQSGVELSDAPLKAVRSNATSTQPSQGEHPTPAELQTDG